VKQWLAEEGTSGYRGPFKLDNFCPDLCLSLTIADLTIPKTQDAIFQDRPLMHI
jgi:hypothetical protein